MRKPKSTVRSDCATRGEPQDLCANAACGAHAPRRKVCREATPRPRHRLRAWGTRKAKAVQEFKSSKVKE